jgi:hypothetical protein
MNRTSATEGEGPSNPPPPPEHALAEKIRLLQEDREHHARAITEIDAILSRIQHALTALGTNTVGPTRHVGAAPSAPSTPPPDDGQRPRRRYQKLPQTGEESVLAFIKGHGSPTTAEINEHWKAEGRPGVANPTVARLLKRRAVQRQNDPAIRGSRYRLA